MRSGRARGPGKAFKNVRGVAPHILEGFPGPPGPARPQKRTPQKSGQTAFRYPDLTVTVGALSVAILAQAMSGSSVGGAPLPPPQRCAMASVDGAALVAAAVRAAVLAKAPRRTVAAVAASVICALARAAAAVTPPRSTAAPARAPTADAGPDVAADDAPALLAALRSARASQRRRKKERRRAGKAAAAPATMEVDRAQPSLGAPRGCKRPLGGPTGAAPMEAEGEPPFPAHSRLLSKKEGSG